MLDTHQAAVVALAGVAAHDPIEAMNVQSGQIVLVSDATSGVGNIAVQLATTAGGTVIGTARPGKEAEYVSALGSAQAVDYSGDIAAEDKGVAPRRVDKALHLAGDASAIGATLNAGGTIASTRGASADEVGRKDVTVVSIMAAATADKLAALLELVAAGKLRVNVEQAIRSTVPPRRSPRSRTVLSASF